MVPYEEFRNNLAFSSLIHEIYSGKVSTFEEKAGRNVDFIQTFFVQRGLRNITFLCRRINAAYGTTFFRGAECAGVRLSRGFGMARARLCAPGYAD